MKILSKKYNKEFNEVLVESYDYFEELGLTPVLTQHTLLGIYRDGSFLDRPNNCHNFMCLGDDITQKVQKKFQADGFFTTTNEGILEFTIQYFKFGKEENAPASVELLPFFPNKEGDMVTNFAHNDVHTWDKKFFKEWGELEFMGKKYRVPKDIEGWFEAYYGPTWKTPDPTFHWSTHSNNMTKV